MNVYWYVFTCIEIKALQNSQVSRCGLTTHGFAFTSPILWTIPVPTGAPSVIMRPRPAHQKSDRSKNDHRGSKIHSNDACATMMHPHPWMRHLEMFWDRFNVKHALLPQPKLWRYDINTKGTFRLSPWYLECLCSVFFPTTLCGVLVFDSVSRAPSPPSPPPAASHISHTITSHTHTNLTYNNLTHTHTHTTLSHTISHKQ